MIRCPICREVIESTDEAWSAHYKSHSTWSVIRHGWRIDPRYTALTLALVGLLLALFITGWFDS